MNGACDAAHSIAGCASLFHSVWLKPSSQAELDIECHLINKSKFRSEYAIGVSGVDLVIRTPKDAIKVRGLQWGRGALG
jgi:hypothetical protein